MFGNFFCSIGIHNYATVDFTSVFHSTQSGRDHKYYHVLYYLECENCRKRSTKDNYRYTTPVWTKGDVHPGIERAKINWIKNSVMYLDPGVHTPKQVPTKKKNVFTLIQGDKKDD